jgi:Putative DNA-binding domain
MLPVGFQKLVGLIGAGRYEASLSEIADLLELESELGVLGKVAKIREFLDSIGVQAIPSLDKGEVDTIRLFRFRPPAFGDGQDVIERILQTDESHNVEFKSTLRIDLKRLAQAGQTVDQCKSDEVQHAVIKTIAAFMNSSGGQLLIGVADDHSIVGLDYDFQLGDTASPDKFELYFRNCITGKIKDGGLANDFISLKFVPIQGKTIAFVEVLPRSPLTFVKKNGQYLLYRRQGNRTTQVDISEIEEYLRVRWA